MTISQAIARLQVLLKDHGDIVVEMDCPICGAAIVPNTVALAKPVVKLSHDPKAGINAG